MFYVVLYSVFACFSSIHTGEAAILSPLPMRCSSNKSRNHGTFFQKSLVGRISRHGIIQGWKNSRTPKSIAFAEPPGFTQQLREEEAGPGKGTLAALARKLSNLNYNNVVVVLGAGVSVSAGIPDFRTPNTGLYDRVKKYDLPRPEAIFDLAYYETNPQPFVEVARDLWPGQDGGPRPTLAHWFLYLLENKGILHRCYTQNIDGLERLAGVDTEKLVECHGHFRSARCISRSCRTPVNYVEECRDIFLRGEVPVCKACGSLVKPDIVFFGEELPIRFQELIAGDMAKCDLLIVMGTSLLVNPVAAIPQWVDGTVPRLLINRELVGDFAVREMFRGGSKSGRDIFEQGNCDDGVRRLCRLAGWEQDLDDLYSLHA